jgi:hypothetical protein
MLTFTTALAAAGIDPATVRLLRHHKVYPGGRTPYSLWRDHRELFEQYRSTQDPARRAYFAARHWASVVVPRNAMNCSYFFTRQTLQGPCR